MTNPKKMKRSTAIKNLRIARRTALDGLHGLGSALADYTIVTDEEEPDIKVTRDEFRYRNSLRKEWNGMDKDGYRHDVALEHSLTMLTDMLIQLDSK